MVNGLFLKNIMIFLGCYTPFVVPASSPSTLLLSFRSMAIVASSSTKRISYALNCSQHSLTSFCNSLIVESLSVDCTVGSGGDGGSDAFESFTTSIHTFFYQGSGVDDYRGDGVREGAYEILW